jgi:hypothetical protein
LEEARATVSVRQVDHERRVTLALIAATASARQAVAVAGEADVTSLRTRRASRGDWRGQSP